MAEENTDATWQNQLATKVVAVACWGVRVLLSRKPWDGLSMISWQYTCGWILY